MNRYLSRTFEAEKSVTGLFLFIPTGGLLERENYAGAIYTPEMTQSVISGNSEHRLDDIHAALIEDYDDFRGVRHLHDDVTYVLL